jgi:hypothetical protein
LASNEPRPARRRRGWQPRGGLGYCPAEGEGRVPGDERKPAEEPKPVSRRQFLGYTGVGAVTLIPGVRWLALPPRGSTGRNATLARVVELADRDFFRAADFVDVTFKFDNLGLNPAGDMLEAVTAGPSTITLQLNRQHVAERVTTGAQAFDVLSSRLAAQSRLVFTVTPPIEFSVAGLLDRSGDSLVLVPLANDPGGAADHPQAPLDTETAIELPWRLYFTPSRRSPGSEHAFLNRTETVSHNEFLELWHTQLVVRNDDGIVEPPEANLHGRFAWTDGYSATQAIDTSEAGNENPFAMALKEADRRYLVRSTIDYDNTESPQITVKALDVDRLFLTALGAQGAWSGEWDGPLASYSHRFSLGRDAFVKVVYRGYLFPTGHPASEVTVSQRAFYNDHDNNLVAYLYQQTFIAVAKTKKTYAAPHQADNGRKWPFRTVEVTNGSTPAITKDAVSGISDTEAYYIQYTGDDYLFSCVATDWDGVQSKFSIPMAFVTEASDIAYLTGASAVPAKLRDYLNGLADSEARRKVAMNGQSVAMAPSSDDETGDTTQPVVSFSLGADAPVGGTTKTELEADLQPAFYPVVDNASVRPGAAEAITGESIAGVTVEFNPDFLSDAFNDLANPAALYLQLADGVDAPDIEFPDVGKSGGVAAPGLSMQAFSRLFGPLGGDPADLNGAGGGSWNPADVFGEALDGARLLGSLTLREVIQEVTNLAENALKLPKFLTNFEYPGGDILQIPERACTMLDWDPDLQSVPQDVGESERLFIVADDLDDNPFDGPTALHLHGEFCVPIAADEDPSYEITGELRNFAIQLLPGFPVLVLYFERIEFVAGSAAPTSVDANVLDVVFAGPFTFIEAFRQWLSSLGNGPRIDVDGEKVTAGVSIDIPDLGFGVFALTQMAFSMDFSVPFNGDPVTVSFGFSSREDPFLVTVLGLGGGGHFGITLSPEGLVSLEFSIDVAAQVSIDLIVASGSVGVTAGFAYEIDVEDTGPPLVETITLIAYVNVSGEMSVLGLIAISVEVEIALVYVEEVDGPVVKKTLTGTASVEVSVDVAFVHTSVSLEFSYTFDAGESPVDAIASQGGRALRSGGIASDEGFHFGDLYAAETDWDVYCEAFAA